MTLYSMYLYPVVLIIDDQDTKNKSLSFLGAHATSAVITQSVKRWTKRMRPGGQNSLSFPSGHTSAAMTSAGYICAFNRDHCGPAIALGLATGYLRIAADKHWASDVVVGAVLGYVSGRQIPILIMDF